MDHLSQSRCVGIGVLILISASISRAELVKNSDFTQHNAGANSPADYSILGSAAYRYLGDPRREIAGWGVALQSTGNSGSVSQMISGIDAQAGRWYRFTFRGLPEQNFTVGQDDLYMKAEFFGDGGKASLDAKEKKIYPLIEQDRRDLSTNGDHRQNGAAVWRTYELDFYLSFMQVDTVRLTIGFGHGGTQRQAVSEFFVTDFSLSRINGPEQPSQPVSTQPDKHQRPAGNLIPIGGRWFYLAKDGESALPAKFDYSNADRLIYHDDVWSAPFEGEMNSWLRAGDKDLKGKFVKTDQPVNDNVTVRFDATSMILRTHGLPNHPTGRFPEVGFGNPNYIQEQDETFYFPLNPTENPKHFVTTTDNSNHALNMGPIGVAVNGVVFFNPFDMGNTDASSLMDYCCGHPNQDNLYHYHKYPICINSPWSDEGKEHSPLIGWAFDGYPIYGPYDKPGVMAKDITGADALNAFNMHNDADRGWHYHVTPGKFPYIIGGYWGTPDPRDLRGPGGRGRGGPGFRGPPPWMAQ